MVDGVTCLDHPSGRSSEALGLADLRPHLADDPGRVTLVPDTAVWGFEILAELSAHASGHRSVLFANQVTVWQALRLAGMSTDLPRLGMLRGVA